MPSVHDVLRHAGGRPPTCGDCGAPVLTVAGPGCDVVVCTRCDVTPGTRFAVGDHLRGSETEPHWTPVAGCACDTCIRWRRAQA